MPNLSSIEAFWIPLFLGRRDYYDKPRVPKLSKIMKSDGFQQVLQYYGLPWELRSPREQRRYWLDETHRSATRRKPKYNRFAKKHCHWCLDHPEFGGCVKTYKFRRENTYFLQRVLSWEKVRPREQQTYSKDETYPSATSGSPQNHRVVLDKGGPRALILLSS